jgi:hypothetical protein
VGYHPLDSRINPGRNVTVTPEEAPVIPVMLYAFAPLHKRAFGMAVGVAGALFMALLTVGGIVLPRAGEFPLYLLEQYFTGYSITWPGVLIGAAWGFVVAFVGGWFAAFCRNLALAITAFFIRTRAELDATREFLDHI